MVVNSLPGNCTFIFIQRADLPFPLDYRDVCMHATSRQDGQPAIYCQLAEGLFFPNQQIGEDSEDSEVMTELRFIPKDESVRKCKKCRRGMIS